MSLNLGIIVKPVWVLPAALGLISCGVSPDPSDGIPINRNNIDFLLSLPPRPAPLHQKARKALFPSAMDRAFELEQKADIVVWYTNSGQLWIDSVSGNQVELKGPPADISAFLDHQPKKSLAVIVVAKNTWEDSELAAHIAFLNQYFLGRGYRRVVIQQAHSSVRPTHSDVAPGTLLDKTLRARER